MERFKETVRRARTLSTKIAASSPSSPSVMLPKSEPTPAVPPTPAGSLPSARALKSEPTPAGSPTLSGSPSPPHSQSPASAPAPVSMRESTPAAHGMGTFRNRLSRSESDSGRSLTSGNEEAARSIAENKKSDHFGYHAGQHKLAVGADEGRLRGVRLAQDQEEGLVGFGCGVEAEVQGQQVHSSTSSSTTEVTTTTTTTITTTTTTTTATPPSVSSSGGADVRN